MNILSKSILTSQRHEYFILFVHCMRLPDDCISLFLQISVSKFASDKQDFRFLLTPGKHAIAFHTNLPSDAYLAIIQSYF